MIETVDMMLERIKGAKAKKVAVVCAHDTEVLISLREASEKKIIKPILIGKGKQIESLMKENKLSFECEIIDINLPEKVAEYAVKLVAEKKAEILMKGLISTSNFLRPILNKEYGLRTGHLLSQLAIFMFNGLPMEKSLILTDAGLNIAPDLMQKKAIIENAVDFAHKMGLSNPLVGVICAIETVNPEMQATIDAAVLSKMNEREQIKGCIVDGPLAMDNVLSLHAATHKGIKSPVAGKADILVAPNIEAANMLYKLINFFSPNNCASTLVGAKCPIILTSRTDTAIVKFDSIVLASLIAKIDEEEANEE